MSNGMSPAVRSPRPATVPASSVEPTLPRRLGRYTLFDRIGRGGMADIFLATVQTDFGGSRLVVVKQILAGLAASGEFSELLITEAKLSALLDHANVVQVHDLGKADGFLYNMVRAIAGTLVLVGSGRRPESWVAEALASEDRAEAGPTAPPQGLFLVRVRYADEA